MASDPKLAALLGLSPRSVEEIIDEHVALRKRTKAEEHVRVPLVTLHLRNGRDVSGWVIAKTERSSNATVLLHASGPDPRQVPYDALYVPIASIEAVTVHDAGTLGTEPARKDPPPGRLQLRRMGADLATALKERTRQEVAVDLSFDGAPEAGDALHAYGDVIEWTRAILLEVGVDDMGIEALKKIRKIWFGVGSHPSVGLVDGALIVTTSLAGPERRMARPQLREAILKAL